MKRTITVVYDGTGYTFCWLKTLLWAKDTFKEMGYYVKFSSLKGYFPIGNRMIMLEKEAEKSHDIVFLAFHHSTSILSSLDNEKLFSVLLKFKRNSSLVCWMDTADSTGTTMFQVMPYVDLYFKKQWLKNKEIYFKHMQGGRIYTDFYYNKYKLDNMEVEKKEYELLSEKYISKCRTSWNVGLGDLYAHNGIKKYLKYNEMEKISFVSPSIEKNYDIHFRGSAYPSAVGYQRYLTLQILIKMNQIKIPENLEIKVTKEKYIEEVKRSKILISPFGWGEICTRDFECFAYGALLFKPDMNHVETFPNWYLNNTYISVDWDFSNFSNILDQYLSDKQQRIEIAEFAQERFRKYRTTIFGREKFANHIIGELQ